MTRITAQEARELAGPSPQDQVDWVYPHIRKAAGERKREIRLYDRFWTQGGYSSDPEWAAACDILRQDGFTVEFRYEERQFVDMYTRVSW